MQDDIYVNCPRILLDNIHCEGHRCLEGAHVNPGICCVHCEDQMVCPGVCRTALINLEVADMPGIGCCAEDSHPALTRGSASGALLVDHPFFKTEAPKVERPTNRPATPTVVLIEIGDEHSF